MKIDYKLILLFFLIGVSACNVGENNGEKLEVLPYFDLKGYMAESIKGLEDAKVTKISRVQGIDTTVVVTLNEEQWRDELDIFFEADINKSSLVTSYDTKVKNEYLIHDLLPNAKGDVKNITVSIINDEVHMVKVKIAKENTFYSSVTNAELYISNVTKKVDHYTIETTQKIWFLKPNNIKILGALRF
ncbi:hypothetical protein [Algoriphagus sp.]|uniref:hypothetical protein n=1 Tax=Algoriphagus sp. TaxID=1872435 RepID=UPI0025F992A0|nr:hypothetical protein [Algoriphagus sp.]